MNDFDPAADFLLHQPNHESLYEPASSRPGEELNYRCKGCRQIIKRWRRLDHWQTHRTLEARKEEARKVELAAERKANLARAREAKKRPPCTCDGGGIGICMCSHKPRKEQAA